MIKITIHNCLLFPDLLNKYSGTLIYEFNLFHNLTLMSNCSYLKAPYVDQGACWDHVQRCSVRFLVSQILLASQRKMSLAWRLVCRGITVLPFIENTTNLLVKQYISKYSQNNLL